MLEKIKKLFGLKDRKKTAKQIIGKIGEDATAKYLKNKGFSILDRNYLKKWGEIDIVAKKDGCVYFVEVKSASFHSFDQKVSHETGYRPEDNVHYYKMQRMRRVMETYLLEKTIEDDFKCAVAIVKVDLDKKSSIVSFIDDVIF